MRKSRNSWDSSYRTRNRGVISGIVIACALVGMGGWLYSRIVSKRTPRVVAAKAAVLSSTELVPNARAREIFQGKRESVTGVADVSPACTAVWNHVRNLDLRESLSDLLARGPLFPEAHGCDGLPASLSETQAMVEKYCIPFQKLQVDQRKSVEGKRLRAACESTLTVYRSQIADHLTRDIPLSSITDPKLLADKSLARWLNGPTGAAEAAERLLEVEPQLPIAAKISAMGRFLAARRAASEGAETDAATWEASEKAIAKAKDLDKDNAALYDELQLSTTVAKKVPLEEVEREAARIAEKNPKSGLGHFFLAYVENRRGNREGVVRELQAAAQAEPGEPRWQEALAALQRTPPGQNVNVFGGRLPFPIESMQGLENAR